MLVWPLVLGGQKKNKVLVSWVWMESMRAILELSSHQCPQRSQLNVRLQKIESFLPLGVGNTFMEWNRNIMKFLPSKEVKLIDYFK